MLPYVLTPEANKALQEIQGIINWNGGLIRREEELNAIIDKATELTEQEKKLIADKLELIHRSVLEQFELLCMSEDGYRYICDVSKVITEEQDGNVLDVLVYLDARYREFAELLDIELQEVEIEWDEVEEGR